MSTTTERLCGGCGASLGRRRKRCGYCQREIPPKPGAAPKPVPKPVPAAPPEPIFLAEVEQPKKSWLPTQTAGSLIMVAGAVTAVANASDPVGVAGVPINMWFPAGVLAVFGGFCVHVVGKAGELFDG